MSKTIAKYDQIGIGYNLTRKADPYLAERLYHHLSPIPNALYLDIGCGTGNYTSALNEKGVSFVGVDPSTTMLDKAKMKNQNIQWFKGTSDNIPFEDEVFEGAIAFLTIHHWDRLTNGFQEINRVLKSAKNLVIFTSLPEQTGQYWLAYYFPEMINKSSKKLPAMHAIEKAMIDAGFSITYTEAYSVKENLEDLFLYSGKFNPEIYFDEQVRNGISSFSDIAQQDEIEQGLSKLRKDIDSGEFEHIMNSYLNDQGDYLYIIANKD